MVHRTRPHAVLSRYLASRLGKLKAETVARWLEEGRVTDGKGRPVEEKTGLEAGEEFVVDYPSPWPPYRVPELRPLDILYEDEWLLAVNKPPFVVLHPARGNRGNTLFHALLGYLGKEEPVRFIHRLDRETSGVVLVAKRKEAARVLSSAFREGKVVRSYLALADGTVREGGDPTPYRLQGAVVRSEVRPERGIMRRAGKEAVTEIRPEATSRASGYTLFHVRPVTGRTHQIRVHLAGAGFPLAGDSLYHPSPRRAREELGIGRAALHAWRIRFPGLGGGPPVLLEAPLPGDQKSDQKLRVQS